MTLRRHSLPAPTRCTKQRPPPHLAARPPARRLASHRIASHRSPPLPPAAQSKRHIKRTKDNPGGIVSVESPLHYSNVSLVDPVTAAPVRAMWRYLEDGSKVRVTRGRLASGSVVPRPEVLTQRRKPLPLAAGPRDTAAAAAGAATHTPGDLPTALTQYLQRRGFHAGAAAGGPVATSATAAAVGRRGAARPGAGGSWRGFAASAWL
jgi:hypothetical protein